MEIPRKLQEAKQH
ncbi:Protein of unknown function [Bacillus cereus]|nr:Protein of unknown function [Bacillus cereus]